MSTGGGDRSEKQWQTASTTMSEYRVLSGLVAAAADVDRRLQRGRTRGPCIHAAHACLTPSS